MLCLSCKIVAGLFQYNWNFVSGLLQDCRYSLKYQTYVSNIYSYFHMGYAKVANFEFPLLKSNWIISRDPNPGVGPSSSPGAPPRDRGWGRGLSIQNPGGRGIFLLNPLGFSGFLTIKTDNFLLNMIINRPFTFSKICANFGFLALMTSL